MLFTRLRRSFAQMSWFSRELLILALCVIVGVTLVPLLIWVVGNHALGPYTHGTNTHAGPLALLADFFVGLSRGEPTFWLVALGPAILIVLLRIFIAVLRRPRGSSAVPLSKTNEIKESRPE